MDTFGYILVLVALILLRSLARGRTIKEAPGDLGDAFVALTQGDMAGLTAVFERTGDSNDATSAVGDGTTGNAGAAPSARGPAILANAKALGSAAKGYRIGFTGPTYYDCSGLVWRTLQRMSIYTGSRFTTASFVKEVKPVQVSRASANIGDIVLWYYPPLTHHMGIVSAVGGSTANSGLSTTEGAPGANSQGATEFYSARDVKDGIGTSPIDGFFKQAPTFWRVS